MSLVADFQPALSPMFRLQFEPAQEAWVLLYPEGMVRLSDTAAVVLRHCNGSDSVAQIIEALQREFPGADLEDDVRGFIADARQHGWVA
jgi:pyrroloquinoline quinone biosynthesis protein D